MLTEGATSDEQLSAEVNISLAQLNMHLQSQLLFPPEPHLRRDEARFFTP